MASWFTRIIFQPFIKNDVEPKTNNIRGIVIAGTHSGSGKTTVTLGLMAALRKKGLTVQPFKCGPDFIDPTLHQLVTGKVSRNLDLWMSGTPFVRQCFTRHSAESDIAVIEGVMGCFDGNESSSAALTKALGLPMVLVVDVRSMAESVAALVKGFEELAPDLRLAGVILNRVGSARHLALLTGAIKAHCRTEILGYLPRDTAFDIPDRHLGLHMGEEAPLSAANRNRLADTVSTHVDLDRLLALATSNSPAATIPSDTEPKKNKVRIGVARDRAFCFYYEDNLELLTEAGAVLVAFRPLSDEQLPDDIAGIYLGGGYPELYAERLTKNTAMLEAIRNWSLAGKPLYAECGGFMYLTEGIKDLDNRFHPMAGVYPVTSRMNKGRTSLGYRQATLTAPTLFGPVGTVMRGHEFHYSTIDPMPTDIIRAYQLADGQGEGYLINNTLGGYLHLHFGFHPQAAAHFIRNCQEQ